MIVFFSLAGGEVQDAQSQQSADPGEHENAVHHGDVAVERSADRSVGSGESFF